MTIHGSGTAMDRRKLCGLYMRVSTAEQSVAPQRAELREAADRKGYTIFAEWEDTISGSRIDRAGLKGLMEAVKRGQIGVVMVVKLDRLGRSLVDLVHIVGTLAKADVALIATSQGIDTHVDNPVGRLQMHVLGAVAEFERTLIRERVMSGMAAAKARGKKMGRPSKKLKATWPDVIKKWKETPPDDRPTYKVLAKQLGGVSTATAHDLANRPEPKKLP